MTVTASSGLFIGWDVGAWNCDKNPSSRDALIVLDGQRKLMGKSWRASLRRLINESPEATAWPINKSDPFYVRFSPHGYTPDQCYGVVRVRTI